MPDATISELTQLAIRFRDEREWKQFHNPKDMALSLVLEASEVLELMQWKNGDELQRHLDANRARLGEELSDVLFWVLAILLASILLVRTGLWREAGFNRPITKNLKLLWFPLFVGILALSGGAFMSGVDALASTFLVVLVAVFAEELVFRGLLWRAFAPRGPAEAMIATSLLAGAPALGRAATDGPWPEAVRITVLAVCGGFAYAALRWRTASLLPVVAVHAAFAFALDISTLGSVSYRVTMILSTLGFVFYGLFLLRNRRARTDGGVTGPKPARVR